VNSANSKIWRDPGGDWKWQAGSVFGTADTQQEARELAVQFGKALPRRSKKRKPRKAGPRTDG
jgi:hypothetical protein